VQPSVDATSKVRLAYKFIFAEAGGAWSAGVDRSSPRASPKLPQEPPSAWSRSDACDGATVTAT